MLYRFGHRYAELDHPDVRRAPLPKLAADNANTFGDIPISVDAAYEARMATRGSTPDLCGCRRPEACVDRRKGRYLATIYSLAIDREGCVRTGEVSDRIAVSPSSVTEMFERLAAEGFLAYQKHEGVALTDRGEEVARELAWRQCIVRTFFGTELKLDLPAETGYRMGFVLPEQGIVRLHELVGRPREARCRAIHPTDRRCRFGSAES